MIHYIGEELSVFEENESLKKEVALLVATLARSHPACVAYHAQHESGYDHMTGEVVYISLPTGQVSWHIRDCDESLFKEVPRVAASPWDGHDSNVKWERISKYLSRGPNAAGRQQDRIAEG